MLGSDNPASLLHAVFYVNGKTWRGRTAKFKISQLKRLTNPDKYVYTEYASKNRCGGLKQIRVKSKSMPIVLYLSQERDAMYMC